MMNHFNLSRILCIVLAALLLFSLGCTKATVSEAPAETAQQSPEPVELLAAAAASLTDVAAELAEAYREAAPHVTITYTFGSSGALQSQIEEGAPADIFFRPPKNR